MLPFPARGSRRAREAGSRCDSTQREDAGSATSRGDLAVNVIEC
jgi:hypothetical protein